ncbi:MAG: stage 0 sporulation family protein [Calditrichaeota bacterium]|nr:stage 0 sporulation family protein [Calditrichota bacterium]
MEFETVAPVGIASRVMVQFKGNRRGFYICPPGMTVRRGDLVIVEADRGEDAGVVRCAMSCTGSVVEEAPAVLRCENPGDAERIRHHRQVEPEYMKRCRIFTTRRGLPMKVADAEVRFDGQKITFFFTAEGRIDFRELVRDLANSFRVRIELRQIGAREERKRVDGYGICGQRLCCVSFLESFKPVTTGMARTQHLLLNPAKLTGACGRLKCCLAFEVDNYEGVCPVGALRFSELMTEEIGDLPNE